MLLVPGMVFTIEPMVNEGKEDFFVDEENEWTVYTEDGSLSAQWEYTVHTLKFAYETTNPLRMLCMEGIYFINIILLSAPVLPEILPFSQSSAIWCR